MTFSGSSRMVRVTRWSLDSISANGSRRLEQKEELFLTFVFGGFHIFELLTHRLSRLS